MRTDSERKSQVPLSFLSHFNNCLLFDNTQLAPNGLATEISWRLWLCTWIYVEMSRIKSEELNCLWAKPNGWRHTAAWVYLRAWNLLGNVFAFKILLDVLYSGFPKDWGKSHALIQQRVFFLNWSVCAQLSIVPSECLNRHTTTKSNCSL